ncbi:MAG: flagellar basal-body rod modification protein FlgD [Halieaceae bacterium]|jgi:flagellar basal-body rod modification protein FlgD
MELATSISELFPSSANSVNTQAAPRSELGQEDFFKLMVAQLENQDPSKPMDNFEFLSQIAQFGTVDGIQGLNEGFSNISSVLYANQAVEAAGLVGRSVVTDSNVGLLGASGSLGATIDIPQTATEVALYIQDMSGRLVHTELLGSAGAGELKIQWDGTDASGNAVSPGQYRISAEAVVAGQNQVAQVYAHSVVDSVTVDGNGNGVLLNLAGGEQVPVTGVKSFL